MAAITFSPDILTISIEGVVLEFLGSSIELDIDREVKSVTITGLDPLLKSQQVTLYDWMDFSTLDEFDGMSDPDSDESDSVEFSTLTYALKHYLHLYDDSDQGAILVDIEDVAGLEEELAKKANKDDVFPLLAEIQSTLADTPSSSDLSTALASLKLELLSVIPTNLGTGGTGLTPEQSTLLDSLKNTTDISGELLAGLITTYLGHSDWTQKGIAGFKGVFNSLEALETQYPNPASSDWAVVNQYVFRPENGKWVVPYVNVETLQESTKVILKTATNWNGRSFKGDYTSITPDTISGKEYFDGTYLYKCVIDPTNSNNTIWIRI